MAKVIFVLDKLEINKLVKEVAHYATMHQVCLGGCGQSCTCAKQTTCKYIVVKVILILDKLTLKGTGSYGQFCIGGPNNLG